MRVFQELTATTGITLCFLICIGCISQVASAAIDGQILAKKSQLTSNTTALLNGTNLTQIDGLKSWPPLPITIPFDNDHGTLSIRRLGEPGNTDDLHSLSRMLDLLELRLATLPWSYRKNDIYAVAPSANYRDGLALSFTTRYQRYEKSAADVYTPFIYDKIVGQLYNNGFRAFEAILAIIPSTGAAVAVDKPVDRSGIRAFKPVFVSVPGSVEFLIEIESTGERFNVGGAGPVLKLLEKARDDVMKNIGQTRFKEMYVSVDDDGSYSGGNTALHFGLSSTVVTGVAGFGYAEVAMVLNALMGLIMGTEPSQIKYKVLRCSGELERCPYLGMGMMWKGGSSSSGSNVSMLRNGTDFGDVASENKTTPGSEIGFNGSSGLDVGLEQGGVQDVGDQTFDQGVTTT